MAETTSKGWNLGIAATELNTASKALSSAFVALCSLDLIDEAHSILEVRDNINAYRSRLVSENLEIVPERNRP